MCAQCLSLEGQCISVQLHGLLHMHRLFYGLLSLATRTEVTADVWMMLLHQQFAPL